MIEKLNYEHAGEDIVLWYNPDASRDKYENHDAWLNDGSLAISLVTIFNFLKI